MDIADPQIAPNNTTDRKNKKEEEELKFQVCLFQPIRLTQEDRC